MTTTTAAPATSASIYQQLRGHLTDLKLADAADALPSVRRAAPGRPVPVREPSHRADPRRLRPRCCRRHRPVPACRAGHLPIRRHRHQRAPDRPARRRQDTHRIYFTSAADLAARCHRAAIEGKWSTMMRFFAGPTLLIIDELGYLPLPGEAASALFQVINQRYLKTSIVITTNRPVLGDTTVAAAMLDRLLHRSVVITLDGASYRLRNHHAAADELRRITTGTNLR